ncbi:hypothetical protein ACFVAF_37005 [Streptomyces sp. NPDC057596]|uniref:hypothetical protein n=1 Tax=Streptomyces sp. NPDC057596 TaxID=3346178 RepID=UPI00368AC434
MSNAELLTEAINTAVTLGWALLAWIAVLAALGTLALLGVIAVLTAAVRTLWRRTVRPSWARGRLRARLLASSRTKRPDERSGSQDYGEAA